MRDARQRGGPMFDDIEAVRTWLAARDDCHGPGGRDRLLHGVAFALMLAPPGGSSAAV